MLDSNVKLWLGSSKHQFLAYRFLWMTLKQLPGECPRLQGALCLGWAAWTVQQSAL